MEDSSFTNKISQESRSQVIGTRKVRHVINKNKTWITFKLTSILPKYIVDKIITIPTTTKNIHDKII